MKKITILLLLLVSLSAFGQTKLDTILFNKVNEYRVSKNLSKLQWDVKCFKASEHHSFYMKTRNVYSHKEDTLFTQIDRYYFFGGKTPMVSEILTGRSEKFIDGDSLIYEKIAELTLNNWKLSKPHNDVLLKKTATYGGCSTFITITEQGIKGRKIYTTYSTMVANYSNY
jgi:uncharacterized protein YkwD